jgi:outer membrane protein insertion porin family
MLIGRLATVCVVLATVPASADNPGEVVEVGGEPPTRKPTGTFVIGAGMSADDGFIAHAEVVQPDLFRTGQRLAMSADVSAIRQKFELAYRVPELLPNIDLDTTLFSTRRDFGDFTREGAGGQAMLSYKLDKSTRIYGRYRLEAVQTALNPVDAMAKQRDPRFDAIELGNGNVATLGAGLVHDTLDERYLPRKGLRLELFTERADRRWGSDYNFERTGGSLDLARGVGPFTLRLHGHAAYIRSRDVMGVPLSERLQHDGHAEVRGFALGSLPALGSNVEAVGRVELELPIWRKAGLSIAGWADAGIRHNTDAMYGATDSPARGDLVGAAYNAQKSVGLSLIWRSPIGPLRFDVAFPIGGRDQDRQYLFGLGGWWW